MSTEPTIIQLLLHVVKLNVSDVFITEGKNPYVRLHGQIRLLHNHPVMTREQIDSFLVHTLLPSRYEEFQNTGDLDFGYTISSKNRFRMNLSKQQGLLSIVARPILSGAFEFADLGIPQHVQHWTQSLSGLILVVGATGSGKSTSLAAMIHHINQTRNAHIVTIEDPVEFMHTDLSSCVSQREVGNDTLSFHESLKRILRQSPDVIMIGEMRDRESIEVALSAAMTGHLVLSTLHTMNAIQTIQRIMSYFPKESHQHITTELSFALKGILAQRLVPHQDGQSRLLAFECLSNTPTVAQLMREQNELALEELMRASRTPEICTFNQSLYTLVQSKKLSHRDALTYSHQREALQLLFQGMGSNHTYRQAQSNTPEELTPLPNLYKLLHMTLQQDASDLHLTVHRPPIIRKVGTLLPLMKQRITARDMRVLLDSVMTPQQRSLYELNKEIDFSLGLDNGQRFRVNAYFQRGDMAASLRTIPSQIPSPHDLHILPRILKLVDRPQGLILVVGPTGSGKSTTLACMINRINQQKSCRIITIEDPIEFIHTSIKSTVDQREVFQDTHSISAALKYILRQDPDVILIGEMRDQETVAAALTAAETGHLVLATLHTNDAIQTIDRIIDIFPAWQQDQIRTQLSSALVAVVSQRLLPHREDEQRVPIFEIMIGTPAIKNVIRDNKMHQALGIMEISASDGMVTMDRALQDAVKSDLITDKEARKYLKNPKSISPTAPIVMSSRKNV